MFFPGADLDCVTTTEYYVPIAKIQTQLFSINSELQFRGTSWT